MLIKLLKLFNAKNDRKMLRAMFFSRSEEIRHKSTQRSERHRKRQKEEQEEKKKQEGLANCAFAAVKLSANLLP